MLCVFAQKLVGLGKISKKHYGRSYQNAPFK